MNKVVTRAHKNETKFPADWQDEIELLVDWLNNSPDSTGKTEVVECIHFAWMLSDLESMYTNAQERRFAWMDRYAKRNGIAVDEERWPHPAWEAVQSTEEYKEEEKCRAVSYRVRELIRKKLSRFTCSPYISNGRISYWPTNKKHDWGELDISSLGEVGWRRHPDMAWYYITVMQEAMIRGTWKELSRCECGNFFLKWLNKQSFCSNACRYKHRSKNPEYRIQRAKRARDLYQLHKAHPTLKRQGPETRKPKKKISKDLGK